MKYNTKQKRKWNNKIIDSWPTRNKGQNCKQSINCEALSSLRELSRAVKLQTTCWKQRSLLWCFIRLKQLSLFDWRLPKQFLKYRNDVAKKVRECVQKQTKSLSRKIIRAQMTVPSSPIPTLTPEHTSNNPDSGQLLESNVWGEQVTNVDGPSFSKKLT